MTVQSRRFRMMLAAACFCLAWMPDIPAWGRVRGDPAPLIGKVDFRALILLHPSMTTYNPVKSAFRLEPGRATDRQLQQRSKEHQQRIQELESQIRALRARMTELHRAFTRDLSALNERYLANIDQLQPGPAGMNRQQFELQRMRLESAHQAQLKAVSGQTLLADQELGKLTNIALHAGYTTPEETAKRFMAIIHEVRQTTQNVAAQRGIQIVLNSGFRRLLRAGHPAREALISPELSYARVFSTPFPQEMENHQAAVAGYWQNLQDMTSEWLKHGDHILQSVRDELFDADIILGGVDLTGEVLTSLFTAYRVDPNIGAAVVRAAVTP